MSRERIFKSMILAFTALAAGLGGFDLARHRRADMPLIMGPGVTKVIRLSEYVPAIKGTRADTHVFFLEGKEPGGAAVLLGDTHANEPEGFLASVIFLENALVERGTVIVIPVFNNSASRNTRPGDGYPLYFDVPTDWGAYKVRMGNRDASPLDQWPDPDVYIHFPDRQLLSFIDARNTNRTWPGRPNGVLMERVTHGALELMRKERVDLAVDFHGAETMFPVTNCIVAPEKSMKIATLASLTVKATEGFENHVEPSPSGFRGLSHREIADYSDTLPFLLEAPIPFLDQSTGPKTTQLMRDGKDPFLLKLAQKKKLFVPYDESGWSLEKRVGQHSSVVLEIFRQFSKKNPDRSIVVRNVPRYKEILDKGVGHFLSDPSKAATNRLVMN